jgi:hypothetical protein
VFVSRLAAQDTPSRPVAASVARLDAHFSVDYANLINLAKPSLPACGKTPRQNNAVVRSVKTAAGPALGFKAGSK